jgi:hypothetical protein
MGEAIDVGHSQNMGLNLAIVSSRPLLLGGCPPSPWGFTLDKTGTMSERCKCD